MYDLSDIRCLKSTCVTIPERLNWRKPGIVSPKFKGKGRYSDLDNLVCDKEEHVGARQIAPLMLYSGFATATVKHHCPKTSLAACVRACSNKVTPDPDIFVGFEEWFINKLMPDWLNKIKNKEVYVDFEGWLQRDAYNEMYRAKMRKAMDPRNRTVGEPSVQYDAFTKIELNFLNLPHEYKDTIENDIKERQICGPLDEKKVLANAFVNKVEELCHEFIPEYCGRKNWMEICKDIENATDDIPNILFGAADGSGFDQTQLKMHNRLMNRFYKEVMELPNFILGPEFSKEEINYILEQSLTVKVSVDHGALKYTSECRASGDGWTTNGNTLLMMSYWLYCFEMARVPLEMRFLRVKGDDVLLALNDKYKVEFEKARKLLFTTTKHEQSHGLGQICKKIDYGCITSLDFLSCYFFYTSQGRLRMTRIPERVIQTIAYSTRYKMGDKVDIKYSLCYSKGKCLQAWARGLPIFDVLAAKMIELGRPGKWSDYDIYADGGRIWLPKDDYAAYSDFLMHRYGMGRRDIETIENKIRSLKTIDDVVVIPELELLFNKS